MELDLLTAISPIDGRYRGKAGALASYFSEFALIKYRVQVEIEYFITLCELPLPQLKSFDHARFDALRAIYKNFSEADAQRIKEIESVTNHDRTGLGKNGIALYRYGRKVLIHHQHRRVNALVCHQQIRAVADGQEPHAVCPGTLH